MSLKNVFCNKYVKILKKAVKDNDGIINYKYRTKNGKIVSDYKSEINM